MKIIWQSLMAGVLFMHSITFLASQKVDIEKNVKAHIEELASDKFGGRAPLSAGDTLTTDYLVKHYEALGLEPGWEGESYRQAVPLAEITSDIEDETLDFISEKTPDSDAQLSLENGNDFVAVPRQLIPKITLDSELIFVGYGINAPDYEWNDYTGIDVEGKTVIVLVNDPGFATQDPDLFTGNAMTYYGRWIYKVEEAKRQGAEAIFIIHEEDAAGYPWEVVKNSGTQLILDDDTDGNNQLSVSGWLHKEAARKLFAQAGLDYQEQKKAAQERGFTAESMEINAQLTMKNTYVQASSDNVLAKLPGSERADEVIIISAHWDHFGTVVGEQGQEIFNGAIDNASGVGGVLELARLLKAKSEDTPFKRSLLFVNFTAEEAGLYGAEYFAANPAPKEKIVAILNIDSMNVGEAMDYVLLYGPGTSELESYLIEAAESQGRRVELDPNLQSGYMYRSDHYALIKQGVPGLIFSMLGDDTNTDFISKIYHTPDDVYNPDWPMAGVAQDLALIADIAETLANSDAWPKLL